MTTATIAVPHQALTVSSMPTARALLLRRIREALEAHGSAAGYPALPFAYGTGAGVALGPFKTVGAGADMWARFISGASGSDLIAACRTAGIASGPLEELAALEQSTHQKPTPAPTPEATPEARPRRPDAIAVLDASGLWLVRVGARGACGEPERLEGLEPTPDLHAGALLELARRVGAFQLWVHASWAERAGLPLDGRGVKPTEGTPHRFIDDAIAHGWDIWPAGLAPWLHCYPEGTYSAATDLALPYMDTRADWHRARDGRELLAALVTFRTAMAGFDYRRSPGATSTGLMRKVHSGNKVALDLSASATPATFPAPARIANLVQDIEWARPLTEAERSRPYVHEFDKNGAYLGASSALYLGLGLPDHVSGSGITFEKKSAGYWRARVHYDAPDLLPDPFTHGRGRADPDGARWYMTPTLELAYQLGARVELLEAYIWSGAKSHRVLTPWYERIRDARAALLEDEGAPSAIALAVVKSLYRQGIGWLDGYWLRRRETAEDLYRPDWRHAVIAQAAANLYRDIYKAYQNTGAAPFLIDVDGVYYASSSPDAMGACPEPFTIGSGLRNVKVKLAAAPLAPALPLLEQITPAGASKKQTDRIAARLRGTPEE